MTESIRQHVLPARTTGILHGIASICFAQQCLSLRLNLGGQASTNLRSIKYNNQGFHQHQYAPDTQCSPRLLIRLQAASNMWQILGDKVANGLNSTDPIQVWKAGPAQRGTFGILSNCILTLGLRIWTSLHLNIPEHNTASVQFMRKLN